MVLPVVIYPNRVLLRVCNPVDIGAAPDWNFIANMQETLVYSKGVGLAANQVGSGQALFVMQTSEMSAPLAIANPVILKQANPVNMIEGCLSLPGIAAKVPRWEYIKFRCHVAQSYLNKWGEEELEFIGLQAQVAQHEIDHLMGMVFPDRLDFVTKYSLLSAFASPNALTKSRNGG